MTPVELGFIALAIVSFVLFMATLFIVSWYVEKDSAKTVAKAAQRAPQAGGTVRHA